MARKRAPVVEEATWACRPCGAVNAANALRCEACAEERGGAVVAKATASAKRCECKSPLDFAGRCTTTGGYPSAMRCPFVCPICRGPLDWSGGCEGCYGCTTGKREDWTFPGDRYELHPKHGHWMRVDGPRKACTPAENAAGFAKVRALLERMGTETIPIGACPRHPEGCGRSGRAFTEGQAAAKLARLAPAPEVAPMVQLVLAGPVEPEEETW